MTATPPSHIQQVSKPNHSLAPKPLSSTKVAAINTTRRNADGLFATQKYWLSVDSYHDGLITIHKQNDVDPAETLTDNGENVTRYSISIGAQTCSCTQWQVCGECKHLIAVMRNRAARTAYFFLTGKLWGTVPEEFQPSDVRGVCPRCAGLLFSCLDYKKDANGVGRGYVCTWQCIALDCGWVETFR